MVSLQSPDAVTVMWSLQLPHCTSVGSQANFGSLPEGAPLRSATLAVASVPAPGPALEDAALAVARKV